MGSKYVLATLLLVAATCGGTLLTCFSKRIRDVFFFLLATLSAATEQVDVNFVSREWYRGTTCGFEVSLVDVLAVCVLVSSIIAPRQGEKRWFWPASLGLVIVYFLYAIFCTTINEPKLFSLFGLSKILRGLIVFLAAAFYLRSERELRVYLLALGTVVCFEGALALFQRYGQGIHRVYGTVVDSNSLSMYFCMTAPIFVAVINSRLPRYLKWVGAMAIALACLGVVLTISRAGVVTILLVMLGAALATLSYRVTLRKIAITFLILICAAGVTAKAWRSVSSRFGEATLTQEYENTRSQGRGHYIRMASTIVADRPFGVGPNNWSYWVSNKYGPQLGFRFSPYRGTDQWPKFIVPEGSKVDDPQAAPAHSLGALTAGEMGIPGLLLFTLLWLRWFQMGAGFFWPRTLDPLRRVGVGIFFGTCGIFFQSLTEWVFHQTPIFFTFNIMLGILAALCHLKKQERRQTHTREFAAQPAPIALESVPAETW